MPRIISRLSLVLSLALSLCACAPSAYMMKQPRIFKACSMYGDNPRQESFDALYETLTRKRGWSIGAVDRKKLLLQARVFRADDYIPLQFSINREAEVVIIRDPALPKELSSAGASNLNRWLGMLEGNYTQRRCD